MPRERPHDSAYKLLFSQPEMVADLIRGYVDRRAAKTLDLKTLERCNGSYVSSDLRERRNDVVWRVRSRQGWIYVYLLIEFQSTVDRYMSVRLLAYVALLWQDLIKQGQTTKDGRLPAVLPIVLYNGDQPWTAPTELRELLAPAPTFLSRYQPQARHLFLDENRVPTSGDRLLRNLAAAIFALEQSDDLEGQNRVLKALRAWLGGRHDLKQAIGTWYARTIAPAGLHDLPPGATISLDEIQPMMATRILKDIERKMAEREARGRAEGRAAGRLEALRDLVRSGDLPVDAAHAQVKAMVKAKAISPKLAKATLALLG